MYISKNSLLIYVVFGYQQTLFPESACLCLWGGLEYVWVFCKDCFFPKTTDQKQTFAFFLVEWWQGTRFCPFRALYGCSMEIPIWLLFTIQREVKETSKQLNCACFCCPQNCGAVGNQFHHSSRCLMQWSNCLAKEASELLLCISFGDTPERISR